MPLLVECSCSADTSNCRISTLTLVIDITEKFSGITPIGATHTLTIWGDQSSPTAPTITLDVTPGSYSIDLPLIDWGPLWNTILVQLETGSSELQVPVPAFSAYDLFKTSYRIDQHYACTNVETSADNGWDIAAYSTKAQDSTICEPVPGDIRTLCWAGRGVNSVFYKSAPLSSCEGCTITDTNFQPGINSTAQVDPGHSSEICLCATGGSGNYTYSIVEGNLPCGQKLNPDTGCIEGSPDKSCAGSPTITFRVTDLGGAGAPVGTSVTIGGTGYLDGSTFVWASGAAFFDDMAGTSITIDGSSKTIVSVDGPYQLTVS